MGVLQHKYNQKRYHCCDGSHLRSQLNRVHISIFSFETSMASLLRHLWELDKGMYLYKYQLTLSHFQIMFTKNLLRLIVAFIVINTCNFAQAFPLRGLMKQIQDSGSSIEQKTTKPSTERKTKSNLRVNDKSFSSNSDRSSQTISEDVLLFWKIENQSTNDPIKGFKKAKS